MKCYRALLSCLCLVVLLTGTAAAQQYGPWSVPVHIGSPISTAEYGDLSPAISTDGLSLYFECIRGNGSNPPCPSGDGIYVSKRESKRDTLSDAWLEPQFVMSGYDPNLTIDGHRMYFSLGDDIHVTRRHNKRDDFGWGPPEYLAAINSPFSEGSAFFFEDDTTGISYLYFCSNRTDLGGPGDMDIYVSTLLPDETWGPPVLVEELSGPYFDSHPVIRRDGLEMFFISNRPGSFPRPNGNSSKDVWTSTRPSTSAPWSTPVNVDADAYGNKVSNVNTGMHEGKVSLSFDGTTLYFGAAQRPGNFGVGCPGSGTCFFDLWVTTREKLEPKE